VTAGPASRESVLAASHAAIAMDNPSGGPGGLPGWVPVDRGKDFLSCTVAEALGVFAVPVDPLPGDTPHLKGTDTAWCWSALITAGRRPLAYPVCVSPWSRVSQMTAVMTVPAGEVTTANSLESRRAPGKPSPMPPAVV
jgi:hypothetical protein